MSKAVVVLSGGMDSTTLLHYVKKELKYGEVFAITFSYGQKHSIELEMAAKQCELVGVEEHRIVNIEFMRELLKGSSSLVDTNMAVPHIKDIVGSAQPSTYCPNRNAIFVSIAASWAEAKGATEVFAGFQRHDEYSGYWDTTNLFMDAYNNVLNLNRMHKIKILAPFVDMSKSAELEIGLKLEVDYSKTLTCYNGTIPCCTTCPTCADRIQAWRKVGRIDPLPYAKPIPWAEWGCK